jgi:hypothetical protein
LVGRAAALAAALLLGACAHAPRSYAPSSLPMTRGERIAVLPLTNLTTEERAPRVIHEALTVTLLEAGGVTVVEPGLVRDAMRQARVFAADLLSRAQMNALGAELEAEYLLVGSIHEFGTIQQDHRQIPVVALHMRLVRVSDAQVVWAVEHARQGDDKETVFGLGAVGSLDRLAQIVVREATASLLPLLPPANPVGEDRS